MNVFITGTDTGVGKTLVTGILAHYLQATSKVVTQKWVQTGSTYPAEDVLTHYSIMGKSLSEFEPYMKAICPYVFSFAASPHYAAQKENALISAQRLMTTYQALSNHFDTVIVEGSGGFFVPLTATQTTADCVEQLALPTLLVIGNKLGCINHTLLTIEALSLRKIPILGAVVTHPYASEDGEVEQSNCTYFKENLSIPVLGILPHTTDLTVLKNRFLPIGKTIQSLL